MFIMLAFYNTTSLVLPYPVLPLKNSCTWVLEKYLLTHYILGNYLLKHEAELNTSQNSFEPSLECI